MTRIERASRFCGQGWKAGERQNFAAKAKKSIFAARKAPMAELVDALVSNTNGAIRPGSSPGRGTRNG